MMNRNCSVLQEYEENRSPALLFIAVRGYHNMKWRKITRGRCQEV